MNWFWNNWFFSTSYNDLAIQAIKKSSAGYTVAVKNNGGFFSAADMIIHYTDGTSETKHLNPAVWQKDAKQTTIPVVTKKKIEWVKLDGGIFMDADESNNELVPGDKKGF